MWHPVHGLRWAKSRDSYRRIASSAGHQRVPKSEAYLNQTFPGAKKGGVEGEVQSREVVGESTGPEGERVGKMREKSWQERGPKAHSKNSDFGTPLIQVLFSGLPTSESYRCDSNRQRSLAVISPPETQKLVLTGPAFVVLRFESRDWRSLVQYSFHVELRNGLRELIAFAERQRLAIGDFAHLTKHMGKKGTIWQLFCALFLQHLEDTVSRCFVYQDLGHTQTPQNLPHFRAFPANIRDLVSRGRCGRKIARLRRLAAVVAAIFLRF